MLTSAAPRLMMRNHLRDGWCTDGRGGTSTAAASQGRMVRRSMTSAKIPSSAAARSAAARSTGTCGPGEGARPSRSMLYLKSRTCSGSGSTSDSMWRRWTWAEVRGISWGQRRFDSLSGIKNCDVWLRKYNMKIKVTFDSLQPSGTLRYRMSKQPMPEQTVHATSILSGKKTCSIEGVGCFQDKPPHSLSLRQGLGTWPPQPTRVTSVPSRTTRATPSGRV